mmetsp:Transcript_30941/g.58789  ORF Transcript_30941/g.58789 Transcript_30941/m.58789 type:complete len:298 (+) Transcript_30941:966-1859(+)
MLNHVGHGLIMEYLVNVVLLLVFATVQFFGFGMQRLILVRVQIHQGAFEYVEFVRSSDVVRGESGGYHILGVGLVSRECQYGRDGGGVLCGGLIEFPTDPGEQVGQADGIECQSPQRIEDAECGGVRCQYVRTAEQRVSGIGDEAVGEGDERHLARAAVDRHVVRTPACPGQRDEGDHELPFQSRVILRDPRLVNFSSVVPVGHVRHAETVAESLVQYALDDVGLLPKLTALHLVSAEGGDVDLSLLHEGREARGIVGHVAVAHGILERIGDDDRVDGVVARHGPNAVCQPVDFGGR